MPREINKTLPQPRRETDTGPEDGGGGEEWRRGEVAAPGRDGGGHGGGKGRWGVEVGGNGYLCWRGGAASMWLSLGFVSALLLGCYDLAKKVSLRDNAVVVVLFLNTLFCCLLFLPLIVASATGVITSDSALYVPWNAHGAQPFILIKSLIVLASWACGYYGIKLLPLTIVGPINATRPMLALVGALLLFGERLSPWQWAGVCTALFSFFLLSRTGKKEGIDFVHSRAVLCVVAAAILGAGSALYDKYLLALPENGGRALHPLEVLAWYNIYQCLWMTIVLVLWRRGQKRERAVWQWRWSIPLISVFLLLADGCYFVALGVDGALVSVLSMVRRSNVLVSFLGGVVLLGEQHWRSKAVDLALVVLAMVFVWIGTR